MRLVRRASVLAGADEIRRQGFRGLVLVLRESFRAALDHDCLNVAQATAYSAMVALFPALIVAAAVVGLLPDNLPLRYQVGMFFDRILPSNVSPLLQAYFETSHQNPNTARALIGAFVVSMSGAASVMTTLMEGFRRAHQLPTEAAGFWRRRGRALALVPLSLIPMCAATGLVVFGHALTLWIEAHAAPEIRTPVVLIAFALRWCIALAGSVGIIAVIYHLGTDLSRHMREHIGPIFGFRVELSWRKSLPGAGVATAMWFVSTLLFGFYVTRYANYSQVYGSLGAAIALMFWLYLIALSVLCGAEFNAQLWGGERRRAVEEAPVSPVEAVTHGQEAGQVRDLEPERH